MGILLGFLRLLCLTISHGSEQHALLARSSKVMVIKLATRDHTPRLLFHFYLFTDVENDICEPHSRDGKGGLQNSGHMVPCSDKICYSLPILTGYITLHFLP